MDLPASPREPVSGSTGWKDLFRQAAPPAHPQTIDVAILRRGGEPLLVVPRRGPAALQGLRLYAAQTRAARMARSFWANLLRFGITFPLERDRLVLDPEAPFLDFLRQLAGSTAVPRFALLAGNPHSQGRRFLVLALNDQGLPTSVVKVGADPDARALIQHELAFLDSAPAATAGLPKIVRRFAQGNLCAFALDFVPGDSPRPADQPRLAPLLTSWLGPSRAVPLAQIPAWTKLVSTCAADDQFLKLANRLQGLRLQPALFHGDFAPWNVKVAPTHGQWTVLDWERGELVGPPAWDWFHFIIQSSVLVKRQSITAVADSAERMLDAQPFRAYAQVTGLTGSERPWLLAYLFHCRDVLGQGRLLQQIPDLLQALAARWQ